MVAVSAAVLAGSSPQMRGAHRFRSDDKHLAGIIPADAGSTSCGHRSDSPRKDHPRRCGEHASSPVHVPTESGSSPQMRGAHWHENPAELPGRIIPADAGSTLTVVSIRSASGDHPRRCGEHLISVLYPLQWLGSSPQMRGARGQKRQQGAAPGIIPADAGSTLTLNSFENRCRDHPRRCGEHFASDEFGTFQAGSSPQMRGAPALLSSDWSVRGIIPADAGSTNIQMKITGATKDHPRRCGEHSVSNYR